MNIFILCARPTGAKIADTFFGALGTFGGPAGAAVALVWAACRIAYDIYKESE